jgi:hypothetical protein
MKISYVSLPLYSDANYKYTVSLEGNSYTLQFIYNERAKLYFLYLYDSEGKPLVQCEAVVPEYPILSNYNIKNLSGFFWLSNVANTNVQPYKTYPDKINQYYTFAYYYETK